MIASLLRLSGCLRATPGAIGTAPAKTGTWLGYERIGWKNRIKWKVQLNARNIIAGETLVAIGD